MSLTPNDSVDQPSSKGPCSNTAADLIRIAKEDPPKPVVTGLLNQNEILVLHGPEESFKSVFVVQLGATIAAAEPFLRRFPVNQPQHVGIIQTEMHPAKLGERLAHMFRKSPPRGTLRFMSDLLLQKFRRTKKIEGKLELIRQWLALEPYDVLMIDTATISSGAKRVPPMNGMLERSSMDYVICNFPLAPAFATTASGAVMVSRSSKTTTRRFGDQRNGKRTQR